MLAYKIMLLKQQIMTKSAVCSLRYVLGIFNPQRFTITVFYDVQEDTVMVCFFQLLC